MLPTQNSILSKEIPLLSRESFGNGERCKTLSTLIVCIRISLVCDLFLHRDIISYFQAIFPYTLAVCIPGHEEKYIADVEPTQIASEGHGIWGQCPIINLSLAVVLLLLF